jgi:hypothetical protein
VFVSAENVMTKQHKFKLRVRERMARTGESYSVARRQLSGDPKPPPTDMHYVRLGSDTTNLVAWNHHHAMVLVDNLAALILEAEHEQLDRAFIGPIAVALYHATKLAAFGAGVAWQPTDRDVVVSGGWPQLRHDKYDCQFDGAPIAASFAEGAVRRLRERFGTELRASGHEFDMQGWHWEKTGSVIKLLTEFDWQFGERSVPKSMRMAAALAQAEAAAAELWSLTSSGKPPEPRFIVEARNAAERERLRSAIAREVLPAPRETHVERMSIEDMALLLAQGTDDEAHHILWVDTAGHLHLDPVFGAASHGDWEKLNRQRVLLRKETFAIGNGYCGRDAARDLDYVQQTLSGLRSDFASIAGTYVQS